jgi:predicted nucleic acid-binding protein
MSAEPAVYLDSSALVKLVVREPESSALQRYLRRRPRRVSCVLARVEVVRAVRPQGTAALTRARRVLERLNLLRLDDPLLDAAAQLDSASLRSLDAIHLAAAQVLGAELESVVTYDVRMTGAATGLGLRVASPT